MSFQVSPSTCRGSNRFSCTYTLVDISKPNPHHPISLNVFADFTEDFPKCVRAGDIIRCTNVKVEIKGGFPKLVGNLRNRSSYITFSRKVNHLTGFSRNIDESSNRDGKKMSSPWGLSTSDWVIQTPDKKEGNKHDFTTSETVKQLHSWAEGLFMGCTLGEKKKPDLTLNEVYKNTTCLAEHENRISTTRISRCDIICMVAAVSSSVTGTGNSTTYALQVHDKIILLYFTKIKHFFLTYNSVIFASAIKESTFSYKSR